MTRRSSDAQAIQASRRYEPSLHRYRFSKFTTISPVDSRAAASRVASRSSGWTKSMNGVASSSSDEWPSAASHVLFSRVKWPSKLARQSRSRERSKKPS
jgi:hypothetical protein